MPKVVGTVVSDEDGRIVGYAIELGDGTVEFAARTKPFVAVPIEAEGDIYSDKSDLIERLANGYSLYPHDYLPKTAGVKQS